MLILRSDSKYQSIDKKVSLKVDLMSPTDVTICNNNLIKMSFLSSIDSDIHKQTKEKQVSAYLKNKLSPPLFKTYCMALPGVTFIKIIQASLATCGGFDTGRVWDGSYHAIINKCNPSISKFNV